MCGPEKPQDTGGVGRKALQLPPPPSRGLQAADMQGAQSHRSNALSWGLLRLLRSIPSFKKLVL